MKNLIVQLKAVTQDSNEFANTKTNTHHIPVLNLLSSSALGLTAIIKKKKLSEREYMVN